MIPKFNKCGSATERLVSENLLAQRLQTLQIKGYGRLRSGKVAEMTLPQEFIFNAFDYKEASKVSKRPSYLHFLLKKGRQSDKIVEFFH